MIIVLGITAISFADPITTSIGENISTNSLTATGLTVNGNATTTGMLTVEGGITGNLTGNVTGNLTGTSTNAEQLNSILAADYSTDAERVSALESYLALTGGTISGDLGVSGITSLATTTLSGDLDLSGNELKNSILEKLADFPSSPVEGQMFYNTVSTSPYWYDETNSRWLSPDRESSEAKYVIFKESDGTVYAKNISTGIIDYSGANASTVANNAISNLTSDRDYKEKVIIKGNYVLSSAILLPSYTILEIKGKLTAGTNFPTGGIIQNSDQTNGNTDIEIIGGTIDGDYANQIHYTHCVYIKNSSQIKITGMRIKNCYSEGIEFRTNSDFIITDNKINNCGDDGISVIYDSNNGVISNNILWGNRSATGGSSGIEIEDGSYRIAIIGNISYGHTGGGIVVCADTTSSWDSPKQITVSDNVVFDNSGNGIGMQSQNGEIMTGVTVGENIVYNNSGAGIYTQGIEGGTIQGNSIFSSGTDGITAKGNFIVIDGNNIYKNGEHLNSRI